MATRKSPISRIYQLKVTLRHIRPPVWRRIQVKEDTGLDKLHQILQTVMGWSDSHLHLFSIDGIEYGQPHPDDNIEVVDEGRYRLNRVVRGKKEKFIYEYDFGDSWEHEILVEDIFDPEPGVKYPRCTKGKRNCPPEDVGGPWGYENFLEAIRNEDHPEHQENLEWIGESFDAEDFDLELVNERLESLAHE